MSVRALVVVIFAMHLWAAPAVAGLCTLVPYLMAIDEKGAAVLEHPTSSTVQALERSLANLEVQRFMLENDVQFAAPVERFIAARMSLVLIYRSSGPDGVHQVSARGDTSRLATQMRALVSPQACAPLETTARADSSSGTVTSDRSASSPSAPTRQSAPAKKTSLSRLKSASRVDRALTVLSMPVSIFAGIVVAGIFGGLVFVAIRRKRRGYARFICFLPVEMTDEQAKISTHLIEISQSGAKVSIIEPLAVGAFISIAIDDVDIRARVVWANSSCAGIQFDAVMPAHKLSEILGENGGGFERETAMA